MKRIIAVMLFGVLLLAVAGCVNPQQKAIEDAMKGVKDIYEGIGIDMDELIKEGDTYIDDSGGDFSPNVQQLPESWLHYPGSTPLNHMSNAYEIDFRNMKVTSNGWILLSPQDVPPGREGWLKVVDYYDSLTEQHDSFSKHDSQGTYKWGDYNVIIDGDTNPDDDTRFDIWLRLELIEPIDPDMPIQ